MAIASTGRLATRSFAKPAVPGAARRGLGRLSRPSLSVAPQVRGTVSASSVAGADVTDDAWRSAPASDRPVRQAQGGPGGYQQRQPGRGYGGNGGGRRYNNNNNNDYASGSQEGRQGGQQGRPRRQMNDRDGGAPGGAGDGRRTWQGPRQARTPEELQQQQEMNSAIRNIAGWRAAIQLLVEKGSQMDAENITSLLAKVAFEKRPDDENDAGDFDGLLSSLLGYVLALLPTYRPRHTTRTLQSMCRMQLYSPEVFNALLERAAGQMGNIDDADLCSIIESVGKMGQPLPPAFTEQLFVGAAQRLSRLGAWELSRMLQALLRLGALNGPEAQPWIAAFLDALTARCADLPSSMEAARNMSPNAGRGQRNNYNNSNRGQQQQREEGAEEGAAPAPRPRFQQRQQRNVQRHRGDLAFSEYVDLVVAVASLPKEGAVPSQELVDGLLSGQAWRMSGAPLDVVSRMLWAVSNFGARPSMTWFGNIYDSLARKDWDWQPEFVTTQCLYLGRYLAQPAPPRFCDKLAKYLENERVMLGVEGVATLLYLLSISQYRPVDRWLDTVLIYLKDNLPSASLNALELVYNALPKLGSGYRLNEVLTDAATRYNAAVATSQVQAEPVA